MMRRCLIVLFLLSVVNLAAWAAAEVPHLINYQGTLRDSSGFWIQEGVVLIEFSIYGDSAQGAPTLWSETHTDVPVDRGMFNVILGNINAFPDSLFQRAELWMGVRIEHNPEMTPRMRITSVPWALGAALADSAKAAPEHSHHSLDAADGSPTQAVYVDDAGRVGVGTTAPGAQLDVAGLSRSRSLDLRRPSAGEKISLAMVGSVSLAPGGTIWRMQVRPGTNDLTLTSIHDWDGTELIPEVMRFQHDTGNIGIGKANPANRLDVDGTVEMTGFKMPASASDGYVLTSDGSGVGTWQPAAGGPDGDWTISGSDLYPAVSGKVGIGTTSPERKLHVDGDVKIRSSVQTPLLVSKTSANNYPVAIFDNTADRNAVVEVRTSSTNSNSAGFTAFDGGDPARRMDFWLDVNVPQGLIRYDDQAGGDVAMYFKDGFVGIDEVSPASKLDVDGTVEMTGFKMPTSASDGYVLTSDGSGVGTWQPAAGGDDGDWTISGNDVYSAVPGNVGIGTTSPQNKLQVDGDVKISSSAQTPLLVSKTAANNYAVAVFENTANRDAIVHARTSATSSNSTGFRAEDGGNPPRSMAMRLDINYPRGELEYRDNAGGDVGMYLQSGTVSISGDLSVTGNVSKGGGSFKIDHPLDPENKYLYHSFVESPDMMNVYNGNVVLDARGEAWVDMPDWFEALNRDYRYQLTCIGGFAPVYVAEEISGNRFKIAGGTPGMKVSWQVTGVRQDAYANAHRIPVEENKRAGERGKYLHPDAFGLPQTMGIVQRNESGIAE